MWPVLLEHREKSILRKELSIVRPTLYIVPQCNKATKQLLVCTVQQLEIWGPSLKQLEVPSVKCLKTFYRTGVAS